MAYLIDTDGSEKEVLPETGNRFTLDELQKLVGGYVITVRLNDGYKMYVDEDGLLLRLPYNKRASEMAGQTIVGKALVAYKKEQLK